MWQKSIRENKKRSEPRRGSFYCNLCCIDIAKNQYMCNNTLLQPAMQQTLVLQAARKVEK